MQVTGCQALSQAGQEARQKEHIWFLSWLTLQTMVLKPSGQTLAKVGDSGACRQLINLGQLCSAWTFGGNPHPGQLWVWIPRIQPCSAKRLADDALAPGCPRLGHSLHARAHGWQHQQHPPPICCTTSGLFAAPHNSWAKQCVHLLLQLLLTARKIDSSVVPLAYPIDRNHPNNVSSDAN